MPLAKWATEAVVVDGRVVPKSSGMSTEDSVLVPLKTGEVATEAREVYARGMGRKTSKVWRLAGR